MSLSQVHATAGEHQTASSFAGRYLSTDAPPSKYRLGERGMPAAAAAQMIKDECLVDGNPTLNLASFVTTWMEPEAHELLSLAQNKNLADQEQYPASNEIQERCINMLASLYNAPSNGHGVDAKKEKEIAEAVGEDPAVAAAAAELQNESRAVGTSTIGSSEAIMLGGLAMKWRWRQWRAKRQAQKEQEQQQSGEVSGSDNTKSDVSGTLKGEGWATSAVMANRSYGPGSGEPPCNMIFSAACHVSLLKTCKYLDIEPRIIPLAPGRYTLDPDLVMEAVDENTIGVMVILGTTLTGAFDPIEEINDRVTAYNEQHGTDISLHVDAASGGFVAPFSHPDLKWDFRLERVKSISTSGHKFGLVYPGVGWIVWREKKDLPEDLVFHVNYLGNDEQTFTLNFSKPAAHVLLQYFVFQRLGREGFTSIVTRCLSNARYLAEQLSRTGVVEIMSENLQPGGCTVPLCVWRLKPDKQLRRLLGFDERELVHELRTRGWIVPAYSLPAALDDVIAIRIVVRESLSHETCDLLLHDIKTKLVDLMNKAAESARNARKLMRATLKQQARGATGGKELLIEQAMAAAEQEDDAGDSDADHADDEARAALAVQILGAVQPSRPHARFHGVSSVLQPTHHGKTLTRVSGALHAGLRAVGLEHDKHADDKVEDAAAAAPLAAGKPDLSAEGSSASAAAPADTKEGHRHKYSALLHNMLHAVHGRASSVHTGTAHSEATGKSKHITSTIC